MSTLELLETATSDGELLARTQISVAIRYLSQGLSFEPQEIRGLFEQILSECVPARDYHVAMRAGIRLVN